MRAVWTLLRRTRDRLLKFGQEVPVAALRLAPVLQAMAAAEAEMLADDPNLPLRRISAPRTAVPPELDRVNELSLRIQELETAVRQREEQIAIMAHDLRGPLSPLMLLLGRLQADLKNPESEVPTRIELRTRVDAISHRLASFVDRLNALLDATRLQVGDLAFAPEPVDLAVVARAIVEEVRGGQHRTPEARFTGVESVIGEWDELRVQQIVRNLVSNAYRFGGHEPIEVGVEGNDEVAILKVKDRGPGIRLDDQQRIFEKHVRLHDGRGFGLGLWIVDQLVDAMGGTISLESAPGAGSEFKVVLPRGQASSAAATARGSSHETGDDSDHAS